MEDEEQLEQLESREEERAGEPEAAAGADDAARNAVVAHDAHDAHSRPRGCFQGAADHRRHLVWHMVLPGTDTAEIRQQEGVRVSVRCARLHILGQLRLLQRHHHHHREEIQNTFENDGYVCSMLDVVHAVNIMTRAIILKIFKYRRSLKYIIQYI